MRKTIVLIEASRKVQEELEAAGYETIDGSDDLLRDDDDTFTFHHEGSESDAEPVDGT